MVKVRESQIPEQDGKPIQVETKKKAKKQKAIGDIDLTDDEIETLIDQSLESKPEAKIKSKDDETQEEEDKVKKYVVHFPDFGVTMSLFGIESLDKDMRFVDNIHHPRWQYGITINKGMNPSERYPVVDKSVWFEKEDVRDRRYDEMMKTLMELGFKVISV